MVIYCRTLKVWGIKVYKITTNPLQTEKICFNIMDIKYWAEINFKSSTLTKKTNKVKGYKIWISHISIRRHSSGML
jgi:hypothetical protein